MKALLMGLAVTVTLAGCASDPESKYASLDNLSDTEQNQALKECFKLDKKSQRHECIAAYAPPEIGFRCERVQVTGTRFGERVCTTQRQRDEVQTDSQRSFSEVQRRNKFVKDQADL
ncbi:putative periplasmic lipoprotein [Bowmanella dokdonensis]|uniref:Lipoprotein n=1 Tax=Bowmanella dokdonensis TaxID=751969 RepID=A0A939IRE5_9ALTE|nr:hypothetical protein [Bowmanella dokdonensis]MBN7825421.1 hypothetical protein [Bowmanella dokdonensis]